MDAQLKPITVDLIGKEIEHSPIKINKPIKKVGYTFLNLPIRQLIIESKEYVSIDIIILSFLISDKELTEEIIRHYNSPNNVIENPNLSSFNENEMVDEVGQFGYHRAKINAIKIEDFTTNNLSSYCLVKWTIDNRAITLYPANTMQNQDKYPILVIE